MNWITTNLQLPEDELKIKIVKKRKNFGAITKKKLTTEEYINKHKKTRDLLHRMKAFSKKIAKKSKGMNFTQGIINMRYEHHRS